MTLLEFRNLCAENGTELTPTEAKSLYEAYELLKQEIEIAVKKCPNFYMEVCNRTTEDKLEDIKRTGMKLQEYNDLQKIIKKICELEGYAE